MSVGFNCGCSCAPAGCTVTSRTVQTVGCNGGNGPAGVTVSVTRSGGSTTTATTDSSGKAVFLSLVAGSYTGSVAASTRFAAASFSFTIASTCIPATATAFITLTPASGYHCLCTCSFAFPVADTLHGTDPCFGSFTLTYDGSTGTWKGGPVTGTIAGCQPGPVSLNMELGGPSASGTGCTLHVFGTWDRWAGSPCTEFGPTGFILYVGTAPGDTQTCSSSPVVMTLGAAAPGGPYNFCLPGGPWTWTISE